MKLLLMAHDYVGVKITKCSMKMGLNMKSELI